MMKNSILKLGGAVLLTAVLVGCAQEPKEEFDAAQLAISNAAAVEADAYVSDLYQAAQDSLEAARVEIAAQQARSRFSRSYRHAEALLTSAASTAEQAGRQVETRKEAVRQEAESLISQAQTAIAEARALLIRAPRGKEGTIVLASLQTDIDGAESSLRSAIDAISSGQFNSAREHAQSALDMARSLNEEMNTAISRTQTPRS